MDANQQVAAGTQAASERFSFAQTPRLAAALRAGDEEAFRWLHQQWNMRLVRYCFVLARGDAELGREIAQGAYIRLFRHVRELPDETALWNWLARAARSAASDLRRTGGRYQSALGRFTEWFRLRGAVSAIEEVEDERASLRALDRALNRLEKADAALIQARYFEQTTLEEIGRRSGASARAIEGRLARLRKRLRELIAAELQNEDG